MAAANDRGAVGRESNGGDSEIVARHRPTRSRSPEVVDSYHFAFPAGERLAVGRKGQRQQSSRLADGPLQAARGGIPDLALTLVTRIGFSEVLCIAPAVLSPIAASAGDRLAVGREGEGANPIAMPFQRFSQTAGGHIPQSNRFVAAGS